MNGDELPVVHFEVGEPIEIDPWELPCGDCLACREGAGVCLRTTPNAIAKRKERERLRGLPSRPRTAFDVLCTQRGAARASASINEILKWLYPAFEYTGRYDRVCLFDELHRYDLRCEQLRGTKPRTRTALAKELGLKADLNGGLHGLLYSDSALFGLVPKGSVKPPAPAPFGQCACGEELATYLRDTCDACLEARWALERLRGEP